MFSICSFYRFLFYGLASVTFRQLSRRCCHTAPHPMLSSACANSTCITTLSFGSVVSKAKKLSQFIFIPHAILYLALGCIDLTCIYLAFCHRVPFGWALGTI